MSAPHVTLDEIDCQRELGWPDFGPEDYCHLCGARNISCWFVDSDRWNAAFGTEWGGIACPSCFVAAHQEATGMRACWKLVPDLFQWPEPVS